MKAPDDERLPPDEIEKLRYDQELLEKAIGPRVHLTDTQIDGRSLVVILASLPRVLGR